MSRSTALHTNPASSPVHLRRVAGDIEQAGDANAWLFADVDAARLRALAARLDQQLKLTDSNAVIAELVRALSGASDSYAGVHISAPRAERYVRALLADGADNADRLTAAGLAAAQAHRAAETNGEYARQLQGALIDALERVEQLDTRPYIAFVFTDDANATGVEAHVASDLALLLAEAQAEDNDLQEGEEIKAG
jgi:hypothetical protein